MSHREHAEPVGVGFDYGDERFCGAGAAGLSGLAIVAQGGQIDLDPGAPGGSGGVEGEGGGGSHVGSVWVVRGGGQAAPVSGGRCWPGEGAKRRR